MKHGKAPLPALGQNGHDHVAALATHKHGQASGSVTYARQRLRSISGINQVSKTTSCVNQTNKRKTPWSVTWSTGQKKQTADIRSGCLYPTFLAVWQLDSPYGEDDVGPASTLVLAKSGSATFASPNPERTGSVYMWHWMVFMTYKVDYSTRLAGGLLYNHNTGLIKCSLFHMAHTGCDDMEPVDEQESRHL